MVKRKRFGEIPQEVSENIKAPETAPSDKRVSGRTKQLNFKVKEEFYWQLKKRAMEEKCLMVEVLEKAFTKYEKEKSEKELEKHVEVIERKPKPKSKSQKKLFPYHLSNFICDKCGDEYVEDTAYSYAPSMNEINDYKTYCSNCVVD